MAKVMFLKGLPASGKSTWAKEYLRNNSNTRRVNKDELRAMLDDSVWSGDREKFILNIRDTIIKEALAQGLDVIVDDTNLAPKHEARIRSIIPKGTEFVVVDDFLSVPLSECIKRDAQRDTKVTYKVIKSMYNQFILGSVLSKEEKSQLWFATQHEEEKRVLIPYDPSLFNCVICDIDGTIARNVSRSPFDYTKVLEDEPIEETIYALDLLTKSKTTSLFFVSGREGTKQCRDDTYRWLNEIAAVPDFKHLFMRSEGDYRKDYIIKKEIYEQNIKAKYNVLCVLDDRNQTVKGWRDLGLLCFQVAEGNF